MIICLVQTYFGPHSLNSVYKFSYGKLKFYLFFSFYHFSFLIFCSFLISYFEGLYTTLYPLRK